MTGSNGILFPLDFLRKWRNNKDIAEKTHKFRHKIGKFTRKLILKFLISENKSSDTNIKSLLCTVVNSYIISAAAA